MSVTIVIGGQFGSEGKGKIVAYMCSKYEYDACVKVGGPNSGHTIFIYDKPVVLRQVPAGVVNPDTKLFIAAGCVVDPKVLKNEIEMFNLTPERLKIDRRVAVIDEADISFEKELIMLGNKIGSTCTGTGSAVVKRILRDDKEGILKGQIDKFPDLKPYLADVTMELNELIDQNKSIIIEGTQGYGLSLYHSPYYPYATSRDTTASGCLSEVGLSPFVVSDIIMVIRTFPIRVAGNSGPLPNETDWETIQQESKYPYGIKELTSVTRKVRRVAKFDLDIVKKAVQVNRPTALALMGVDYLDYKNRDATTVSSLSKKAQKFIRMIETETGVPVKLIGTKPEGYGLIDLFENFEW